MKEITGRLATLGTQFTQILLADERDWFMPLAEEDLDGLPDFAVQAARAAGQGNGFVTRAHRLFWADLQVGGDGIERELDRLYDSREGKDGEFGGHFDCPARHCRVAPGPPPRGGRFCNQAPHTTVTHN